MCKLLDCPISPTHSLSILRFNNAGVLNLQHPSSDLNETLTYVMIQQRDYVTLFLCFS